MPIITLKKIIKNTFSIRCTLYTLGLSTLLLSQGSIASPSNNTHQADEVNNDNSKASIPVYTYWQGESSEARKPFERELIKLVFTLSEEKYGAAELNIVDWQITTKRSIQMMKDGQYLQIQDGPVLMQSLDPEAVIVVPHDILNNLLGYRSLIVDASEKKHFENITSLKAFKQKVAGQGIGWNDVLVYQHNGINVVEAPSFKGLFPMLAQQRFDYLPLGIIEAENAVTNHPVKGSELTTVNDLIIFYPWPVKFIVSKKFPELAERINYGMEKAIANGEHQKLFDHYFGKKLTQLKNNDHLKIVYLTPPGVKTTQRTTPSLITRAVFLE